LRLLYRKLADSYIAMKEENDKIKQDLHNQKLQAKMLTSSQNDLQLELESISNIHRRELERVEKKNLTTIGQLKEKNLELLAERAQLESKVLELSNLTADLKKQCDELENKMQLMKPVTRVSDGSTLRLELENDNLRQLLNEQQAKLDAAEVQNLERNAAYVELKEKILCLEDNLETKKSEIDEKNDKIECLHEELNDLTVELAVLKNVPEDQSKFPMITVLDTLPIFFNYRS
jgi:chromosome segregation ATPase